jgi:hypothetical protein
MAATLCLLWKMSQAGSLPDAKNAGIAETFKA